MADKLTTAFLKGVASITDTARLAEIERALDIGTDAVLRVLNIEDAAKYCGYMSSLWLISWVLCQIILPK